MTYPVTDTLTRIKNAHMARKDGVLIPSSKFRANLVKILKEQSYVGDISEKGRGAKKYLSVSLEYSEEGLPRITDFKTISKPSQRIYASRDQIGKSRRGGIFIVSTPKGIMTGREARKKNLGGEVLCEVW